MPNNLNSETAWNYHEATRHSYTSVRTNPHFLDFGNQPLPFKIYTSLEPARMPSEMRQTGVAALSAIAGSIPAYPPVQFGLRQLRTGDYRSVLVEATGGEPAIAHAPLTIVCTCTYWRNAWKYQARTYRHFGWDNGTLLANLLAVATALGLPARVVSKPSRSLNAKWIIRLCEKCTPPLRSILPGKWWRGAARLRRRIFRRPPDQSFSSNLCQMPKCRATLSSRSSSAAVPPANLPAAPSLCRNFPPCSSVRPAASQRISSIRPEPSSMIFTWSSTRSKGSRPEPISSTAAVVFSSV